MKRFFIAACALMLTACISKGTVSTIDMGMNRASVVNALGQPDADSTQGDVEIMQFNQRRATSWHLSRQNYQVILLKGEVIQITPQS